MWLPFKEIKDIGNLIAHAYNEGLKAGWGNDYEPQPMTFPQGSVPVETKKKPAIRELELVSEDTSLYRMSLFDDVDNV